MRLRTKFFLITAATTIVPVVGATMAGRAWVERNSRAEFQRHLAEGQQEVDAQYRALRQEVSTAVKRLADPEDNFIGPLLIALAKGGPDDEQFRQLPTSAPRVMRERGLDVLTVLGPKRRVLASGHFPGRTGDTEVRWPTGARLRKKAKQRTVLVGERVMHGGRPATRLTVEVWRKARSPLGTSVRVGGGRFVDESFLRRLRFRADTKVLLSDARGRPLVAPPGGWRRYRDYPRSVVELRGADGKVAATITLAVSDERLKLTLEVINYLAGALVAGGLLLSLLLGALVRPITRPLERLVVAAEAVAAGDLDHRIEGKRGKGDEVGELIDSFNRMISELKDSKERLVAAERVAAWREIARRIAHEIKNPLFPIQTSIETLRKVHEKKHPDFEEIFAESTTTILEEVARLKRIVTEFSNFARMPKPSLASFDLGDWIHGTVGLYATEGLRAHFDVEEGLTLVGDREQLTQVLANLVQNARDATRGVDSPRVDVKARAVGESIEPEVADNGIGFDEASASQIFTPYFTTKKDSGGTGLGLAICHRIVTDHGGTIEATGASGGGARFLLRLPQAGPSPAATGEGLNVSGHDRRGVCAAGWSDRRLGPAQRPRRPRRPLPRALSRPASGRLFRRTVQRRARAPRISSSPRGCCAPMAWR